MSIKISSKIILAGIFMLFSSACTAVNGDGSDYTVKVINTQPDEKLKRKIYDMFEQADKITVRHIPNANMGRYPLSKKVFRDRWKYMFSYACPGSCKENAKKLQAYFASGLKLAEDCPKPYYALVELFDKEGVASEMYVHQSGRCFTLLDESYYTEDSFSPFVERSKLYPDFVK